MLRRRARSSPNPQFRSSARPGHRQVRNLEVVMLPSFVWEVPLACTGSRTPADFQRSPSSLNPRNARRTSSRMFKNFKQLRFAPSGIGTRRRVTGSMKRRWPTSGTTLFSTRLQRIGGLAGGDLSLLLEQYAGRLHLLPYVRWLFHFSWRHTNLCPGKYSTECLGPRGGRGSGRRRTEENCQGGRRKGKA